MVRAPRALVALLLAVFVALMFRVAAAEPASTPALVDPPAMPMHGPDGVACVHCHADPHSGDGGDRCQRCHAAEAWNPPLFTVQEHAGTAFPLLGRHQRVACEACHVDDRLRGLPTTCSGCHVDRHRGKLGDDCAECHDNDGFRPVTRITFVHAERTGFALSGPHDGVQCAACHQGDNGRAMRVVQDATCATCHAVDHGDFGGDAACGACHAATFANTAFDHLARTAFPLARRHAALECSGCHPIGSDASASDDRCQSCHVQPHAGQLGTGCADCHQPDRWRVVRFDHDRTPFPLRGRHFVTPCASCHTAERWLGLSYMCWDCHAFDLKRALATRPDVAAHGRGLPDCSDCHNTWRF